MNTNIKHLLVAGCAATLISSCASNHSPATSQRVQQSTPSASAAPSSFSSSERAVAEQVFVMINNERARNGKKKLRGNPALNALAKKQSDFLAKRGTVDANTAHHGAHNRAQYAYLRHNIENTREMVTVAGSASEAVSKWKGSQGHRKHMMQAWDVTGVGVTRANDGRYYIVQAMGAKLSNVPRSVRPIGW